MKKVGASVMPADIQNVRMWKIERESYSPSLLWALYYKVPTIVDMIWREKMITVGIRELKQQTSKLVNMVHETGNEVQITYHGQVVALLVPVKRIQKDGHKAWIKLDELAAEIGARLPKGVSVYE